MRNGINENGVFWMYDEQADMYYCDYYLGDGSEVSKSFSSSSIKDINDISFEDLLY